MKQQDKLRNTLRKHFDNKAALFNESDWEKASVYLAAARSKRSKKRLALLVTFLISTLFLAFYSFQSLTNDYKKPNLLLNNQRVGSSLIEESTTPPEIASHAPNILKETLVPNLESKILTPTVVLEQKSDKASKKSLSKLLLNRPLTKKKITLSKTSANATSEKKNVDKEKPLRSTNPVEPTTHIDTMKNDSITPNEAYDANFRIARADTLITNSAKDDTAIPHDTQQIIEELSASTIDKLQQMKSSTTNKQWKEFTDADQTPFLTEDENKLSFLADSSHNLLNTQDSLLIKTAVEDSLAEYVDSQNLADEGFFYDLGVVWHYGWKNPTNRDARGFSPIVGINYMNRLSNRSSISFGAQYLQVRNLSNSSKTSRVSTYLYGEQSTVTVVTPSTLHYLVAPLRLHYYINPWNRLGAGVNLAYLMTVDANVSNYEEKPGFTGNAKTIKLSGYTEGFSWFDSQLAFFYRRRITNSFELQTDFFLGLIDVKQNDFFSINSKERNSGIKLTLVYFAFRKKNKL